MKVDKETFKKIGKIIKLVIEIAQLIKQGLSEKDAIKNVAVKHNISSAELDHIWKKYKKNSA